MSANRFATRSGRVNRPRWRSLRTRILVWHTSILAIVLLGLGVFVSQQQWRFIQGTIDGELLAAVREVQSQLESTKEGTVEESISMPETFRGRRYRRAEDAPYLTLSSNTGELLISRGRVPPSSMSARETGGRRIATDIRFYNRGPYYEAVSTSTKGIQIRIGRDVTPDWSGFRDLIAAFITGGFAILGLGIVGGWFLSARSIRPIADISRIASEISEQNLSRPIELQDTDEEFEQLACTLNTTFARLHDAFEKQRGFTADASHELRTPLSVIQMHQELALSKDRSPEEYRTAIQTCQRATRRMNQLIESLLTLARLESDDVPPNHASVNVNGLINRCLDEVRPLATSKEISLTLSNDSDANVLVHADEHQLFQVFTNLLNNAIAYSHQGEAVDVSIELDGDELCVSVTDHGIGIPAEHLSKIFDRFHRVDDERSRQSGGVGLGLAICQKIVHAHGGQVGVDSQVGSGSVFRVKLPAIPV